MSSSDFSNEINTDAYRVEVLEELAEQVRTAHTAVLMAESNALDSALDAGAALLVIQSRIAGTMKSWMAKNLAHIGISTWKLYMQLARHQVEIEAARKQNPQLSLCEARRLITKKKPFAGAKSEAEGANGCDQALQDSTVLTDAQVIAGLTARGPDWLLANLPVGWCSWLQARLRGQILRSEQTKHPNVKLRHLRIVHSEPSTQH